MKLYTLFLAGLCTIPCIATNYRPNFFGCHIGIKDSNLLTGIIIDMHGNPPLYFITPNNTRDYVKNVLFNISQQKDGNYDVDYIINSYNNTYTIQAKGVAADAVDQSLQNRFPQVFTAQKAEQKWIFLRNLRTKEVDRALFRDAVALINNFLSTTAQLKVDQKDFAILERSEWGSWFSLNSWRNYFRRNSQ